jgi:hypothetical protein
MHASNEEMHSAQALTDRALAPTSSLHQIPLGLVFLRGGDRGRANRY